jgi:DNA-binding NtrC family response regulator
VLAATNRDLAAAMRDGTFREDLFFRLNVCNVALPPLRERREDIPALAEHFLRGRAHSLGKPARRFSPGAAAALAAYPWPGNVRELENIVERAVILAEGETIGAADLSFLLPSPAVPAGEASEPARTLEEVERRHIARVLGETGGNQKRASEILGIDRKTLYLKLKRHFRTPGE